MTSTNSDRTQNNKECAHLNPELKKTRFQIAEPKSALLLWLRKAV
jgi:hypothetical protein